MARGKWNSNAIYSFRFRMTFEKQIWMLLFVFRFRITLKNGYEFYFSFFRAKTKFSFSHHFEKRIWISFLHCLLLKNRLKFRLSFLHEFDKWINTPVIWNSAPPSLWPRREENSLTFSYIKSECPGQPRGGGRGFKCLDWCSDTFFKSYKNDKRNSDLVFKVMRKRETKFKSVLQSNVKTKNEIHIRFSKWCENEKRKLKLISVFQSDAKTKNETRSSKPFFKVRRKRKNRKQNSNLFFNVMRKWKMDMALEFPFLMPSKNGWH